VKLTKDEVLRCVGAACAPWSNYIGDEVDRWHRRQVQVGGTGHNPTRALILRRLNQLAEDGLLEKSSFINGYYGYKWTLTPSGRAALQLKEST